MSSQAAARQRPRRPASNSRLPSAFALGSGRAFRARSVRSCRLAERSRRFAPARFHRPRASFCVVLLPRSASGSLPSRRRVNAPRMNARRDLPFGPGRVSSVRVRDSRRSGLFRLLVRSHVFLRACAERWGAGGAVRVLLSGCLLCAAAACAARPVRPNLPPPEYEEPQSPQPRETAATEPTPKISATADGGATIANDPVNPL
jgi:hypothetical protein